MSYSSYAKKKNSEWGRVVVLVAVMLLMLVFEGWVISTMWNWFVPRIFLGLPSLTLGHAIGLALVVDTFRFTSTALNSKVGSTSVGVILVERGIVIAVGIVVVITGWLIQLIVF